MHIEVKGLSKSINLFTYRKRMDQNRLGRILAKLDSYKLWYATVVSAPGVGTFSSI